MLLARARNLPRFALLKSSHRLLARAIPTKVVAPAISLTMLEMRQMFPVHGHAPRSASPNLCGFRWSSLSARTPKQSSILQTAAAAAAAVATPGVQAKAAEHPQQHPERTLQTYRSTCDFCSSKKLRCSGGATCDKCMQKGLVCVYR
jgi:Fungal Zn(2)-Cys(6) binuclear cluster domain